MYVCVCVYVCMYVRMYVRTYVCMYVRTYRYYANYVILSHAISNIILEEKKNGIETRTKRTEFFRTGIKAG